ncbi:hypothetical protein ACFL6C_13535 [Myxococcota bacterium]
MTSKSDSLTALSLQLGAGLTSPRENWIWGGGLGVAFSWRLLQAHASASVWTPLHVSGQGYDLRAQLTTARIGLGVRYPMPRLRLEGGADMGIGLRVVVEDRRGAGIPRGRHWYASPSLQSRLHAVWPADSVFAAELAVLAERFYSHQVFLVGGEPVLNLGRWMVRTTLGLRWAL